MESIIPSKKEDIRTVFDKEIKKQSRTIKGAADALLISKSYLNNILKCRQPLSDENSKKLDIFLGTNYSNLKNKENEAI